MNNRGFSAIGVILGIVILSAIAVGGAWVLKKQQTPIVQDKTANWKTYRNETLGIEFLYQPDFSVLPYLNQEEYIYGVSAKLEGAKLVLKKHLPNPVDKQCSHPESQQAVPCIDLVRFYLVIGKFSMPYQTVLDTLASHKLEIERVQIKPGVFADRVSIGAEGEGLNEFYLPAGDNETLVLRWRFINTDVVGVGDRAPSSKEQEQFAKELFATVRVF